MRNVERWGQEEDTEPPPLEKPVTARRDWPLVVHVRRLEAGDLVVQGEITAGQMELGKPDELLAWPNPLRYDLVVEQVGDSLLATGCLEMEVMCACARCLKVFPHQVRLEGWRCLRPLVRSAGGTGGEDLVDLTPYVREDILLAFPQHPLCEPGCRGLPPGPRKHDPQPDGEGQNADGLSAWSELDKLKLQD